MGEGVNVDLRQPVVGEVVLLRLGLGILISADRYLSPWNCQVVDSSVIDWLPLAQPFPFGVSGGGGLTFFVGPSCRETSS